MLFRKKVCTWIHYTINLNCIFQVNFDTCSGVCLEDVDICYQKYVHAATPRPRLYFQTMNKHEGLQIGKH
jgi:hypothetical protein